MRHIICSMLLTLSCISYAQHTTYIPSTHSDRNTTKRGELPPVWILNKVTPEQYDTLAILNRLTDVDYSPLKSKYFGKKQITGFMPSVREYIVKAMRGNAATPAGVMFFLADNFAYLLPDKKVSEKNAIKTETTVFSSSDGYDAHVRLEADFVRDRSNGTYTARNFRVIGYSVSRLHMVTSVKLTELTAEGEKEITSITTDKKGVTPSLLLSGTVTFTDPLGNKHEEQVKAAFGLDILK